MIEYDRTIADVMKRTLQDAQDLVRDEIALAKAELRTEVRRVGVGVATLAGAAVAGLLAVIFLLTAAAWAVAALAAWPVWAGFAVVGLVVAIAAGLLAMVGRNRLRAERHMPLTVDTMKENLQWMKAPESLAERVHAKRNAVDNDLELLRVRLQKADPRRTATQWARAAIPMMAGAAVFWWWARSRRSVTSLDQLLRRELADLYASEQAMIAALKQMAAHATNVELQRALEHHLHETQGQVERLERVFRSLGVKPRPGSADAICALAGDARRRLRRQQDPDVRDAWLIAAAQRIEHLEIANYGTTRAFAETLGYTQAAQLLQETLEEERHADQRLTRLAAGFVNPQSIRVAATA